MVDAQVRPIGSLELLSQLEIERLEDTSRGGLHSTFRNCALAVLNCDSPIDDAKEVLETFHDFSIRVVRTARGIKLSLKNAPAFAFVDGKMIRGIREHLFSVLRDVLFVSQEFGDDGRLALESSPGITNAIFHILRNAEVLRTDTAPDLVVCWGGHSINLEEYDYTKEIGYQLGLRGLNICTGCGPGAMKGPMKGATIAHAKQRIKSGRYLGVTEPGIIAAEPPNPIVNELVILPDIEKRLEAFVRTGHGFVVFPGGVGTTEEILYLLGIQLHPENAQMPFPLIFTGPASSRDYFRRMDDFIAATLGAEAQAQYKIIINDPAEVAREIEAGLDRVHYYRLELSDAFYYNWLLKIEHDFQVPFLARHDDMAALNLTRDQDVHELAANLRRAFSGIVSGNVKETGIQAIEQHGPFEIRGDADIMKPLDGLLKDFVAQNRMKLAGRAYTPCYRLVA